MNRKPYLIFDAGGTLVFPDYQFLMNAASQLGIQLSHEDLFEIHCNLIYQLDHQTKNQGHLQDPFHNGYARTLLKNLVNDDNALDRITQISRQRDREVSLWTYTYPWVADVLDDLKSGGYQMAVISNSDGRVAQILKDTGLSAYFDRIFDSNIIGMSKPDPNLFKHALGELRLHPEDAIYIGDVYYIDVWGANRAGLGCIHLDPRNLYTDWPGVHIPTIAELPAWLTQYQIKPAAFDLFPTDGIEIDY